MMVGSYLLSPLSLSLSLSILLTVNSVKISLQDTKIMGLSLGLILGSSEVELRVTRDHT